MRLLLLANATASSVTARTRVLIQTLLNDRHDVQLALTQRRGHAARLAREAAASGIDVVVVLAGDGTLNEVANGLAGTKCALGALPGGSTNVFARTIGTDDDPLAATTAICDSLDEDRIELIGLGEATPLGAATPQGVAAPQGAAENIGGRLFLFHCGIGFDAAVVKRVEQWPKLKRYLAHPLYLVSAMAALVGGELHNSPMTVSLGSESGGGTASSADAANSNGGTASSFTVVLNTDPYTYLGSRPLSVAPAANLHNGLSVVALRTTSPKAAVSALTGALRNSDGIGQLDSSVIYRSDDLAAVSVMASAGKQTRWGKNRSASKFGNQASNQADNQVGYQIGYQIDGDYLGKVAGLSFTHRARILPVVLPQPPVPS